MIEILLFSAHFNCLIKCTFSSNQFYFTLYQSVVTFKQSNKSGCHMDRLEITQSAFHPATASQVWVTSECTLHLLIVYKQTTLDDELCDEQMNLVENDDVPASSC